MASTPERNRVVRTGVRETSNSGTSSWLPPVAAARWRAKLHLHCASHREAATRFATREYPRMPPRLDWIFTHNPLFFVTFCTCERRKVLTSDAMHKAFITFATK